MPSKDRPITRLGDALAQLFRHGAPVDRPTMNAGPIVFLDGEWIGEDAPTTGGSYIEDPWGA